MSAASGDVFFSAKDGSVYWLDTGQGLLTQIASSQEQFLAEMRKDGGAEWLLSPVIDRLLDSGLQLDHDQCFAFKVLPILGGTYTPENMVPMSAAGWYGFSGYAHHQIKDLPEGTQIRFALDET